MAGKPNLTLFNAISLDRDYSSDGPDDDGYDYGYESEVTLDSIKKSTTIRLSISANYTNWGPREAFRELVQNWRDGIIKSFKLPELDFCVIREEKVSGRSTEIVYKVFRAGPDDTKEWLGFIRFKGIDGYGTVEITNRNATLQPWHLDLGGTSKAGDECQAGAHGEGLKLALVVMMRFGQNHSVRCRSGGFTWIFDFTTRRHLVARLNRMSPSSIARTEDQARRLSQRSLLPFAPKPDGDVQFLIGEGRKGRNQWGDRVDRKPVSLSHFEAWTKAALFLYDAKDGDIISSPHGDLLVAEQLRESIYLKGLLLQESIGWESASITGKPLKFGYNFASGRTNRERQSLAYAAEESRAILAIWMGVLAAKSEMVKELSDMLNDAETEYADVEWAEERVEFETASLLRDYLFGEQFAGRWYYSGEEKKQNPRLSHVIQGLECEGVELTKPYWNILRKHSLIRTAEEEQHRRFTAAPPAILPNTPFATSVQRLLRACIRSCPKTDGMTIEFVQAGQLHIQLFFSNDEQLFRIHERWLDLNGAFKELGFPQDLAGPDDVAFHVVKSLFSDALHQLPGEVFREEDDTRTAAWRRRAEIHRAEQRLLNYFRIEVAYHRTSSSSVNPGIEVHWSLSAGLEIQIQCHRASRCSSLSNTLLVAEDACSDKLPCLDSVSSCGPGGSHFCLSGPSSCQVKTNVWFTAPEFLFLDFKKEEECFFLVVTPDDPSSFVYVSDVFRVPSSAGVPHKTSSATAEPAGSPTSFTLGAQLKNLDIFSIDRNRWYEAKSSENVRAVVGIVNGEKRLPGERSKRARVEEL